MTPSLRLISSMATRALLADLADACARRSPPVELAIESVGGVDAARRVRAGEAFDAVVLAADAIDALIRDGHVVPGSRVDLVRSAVAVAVRAGAARPDIGSEAAVRGAVLAARSLGYSTGPSGTQLLQLFERWGIAEQIRPRQVQAPPGVPVGRLVAEGQVELGFQQASELMNLPGITVLGALPSPIQITTVFAAGLAVASTQPARVRALLAWMASPATADIKQRNGMEAAA
jgi:molybdate transport system substrate-binding protein